MKCEFGFCANCEKEISAQCPTCNHRRIDGQYTEVTLPLNNGTKMVVAVCLDCTTKIFHADKKALMESIKAEWRAEHVRNRRPLEVLESHEQSVKDLEFA